MIPKSATPRPWPDVWADPVGDAQTDADAALILYAVNHIEAAEAALAEARALAEAYPTATPGPWHVDTTEGGGWAVVANPTSGGAQVIADLDDTVGDRAANAALIVAAVNALRAAAEPETA